MSGGTAVDPGPASAPGHLTGGGEVSSRTRRWHSTGPSIAVVIAMIVAVLTLSLVIDEDVDVPQAAAEELDAPDCEIENPSCGVVTFPKWSDESGWTSPARAATIAFADIDGDGKPEMLGRAAAGLEIHTFRPADATCSTTSAHCGQWVPFAAPLIAELADSKGYTDPALASSIQPIDVEGDGRHEVMWYDPAAGIRIYGWSPGQTGFKSLTTIAAFIDGTAGIEYSQPRYVETIQAADIDGAKGQEILMRGPSGLLYMKHQGDQGFVVQDGPRIDAMADSGPFGTNDYLWRSIDTADFDGDGAAEVFATDCKVGVSSWKLVNNTWTPMPPLDQTRNHDTCDYGENNPAYYNGQLVLDVDGDGHDELMLRYIGGPQRYILVAHWSGTEWEWWWPNGTVLSRLEDPAMDEAFANGGVTAADLDGDKRDELYAHSAAGVDSFTFGSLRPYGIEGDQTPMPEGTFGGGEGPTQPAFWIDLTGDRSTVFAAADGYTGTSHHLLLPWVSASMRPILVSRNDGGIRTAEQVDKGKWSAASARYPQFTGAALTAYVELSQKAGASHDGGIRLNYAKDKTILQSYRTTINSMDRPADVDEATWKSVRDRIDLELRAAIAVDSYYDNGHDLLNSVFTVGSVRATSVAHILQLSDTEHTEAVNRPIETLGLIIEGIEKATPEIKGAGPAVDSITFFLKAASESFKARDHQGEFSAAISQMDAKMADAMAQTSAQTNRANSQIILDYGLMMTIGGLVEAGDWVLSPEERNMVLAAMQRGAELGAYQSLMPAPYEVWVCAKDDPDAHYPPLVGCPDPAKSISRTYGAYHVYLAFKFQINGLNAVTSFGQPVDSAEVLKKLFDAPAATCATEAWESECGFGLTADDIYNGHVGWHVECASAVMRHAGRSDFVVAGRFAPPCNHRWASTGSDGNGAPEPEGGTGTVTDSSTTLPTTLPTTGATPTSAAP